MVLLISLEDGAGFGWMGAGTTRRDFLGEVPESAGFWDGVGLLLGPLVEASAVVGLQVGLALSYPFEEVPEGDEVADVVVLRGTLDEGLVGVRGIPLLDPLGWRALNWKVRSHCCLCWKNLWKPLDWKWCLSEANAR